MNPQQLFSSLEAKYRLPEGYLSRVYQLESSGGKNVYNEQSGAAGPFQFMPGTAKGMGLQDPYDLAQSADAAARLAAQNRAYLQKKGVEEVDGRVLYLAHVQGADGAYRLMENADKPATSVVGEKPVVQNAGRPEQKAGEFAGSLMDRYQPAQAAQEGPYSALGTSAPVDQTAEAAPSQASREADSGDERRRARALNTLLSISQGLQQDTRVQPMPAPRLSYAEGGIVNFGPEVPGFWDGGFVDFGFSAPSYSYTPAYEPPSYSYTYTPAYEPPSYSYTPTEVYSPPFTPPAYEYTYTQPDAYVPYTPPAYEYPVAVVPDLFEGSRLDYTTPTYTPPTYAYTYDPGSSGIPLYTGGDTSLGGSVSTGGDIYTGDLGYSGVPGSVFTDALVDAGYGQPTEYIGVATNPPGYMQPVFDNIMETVVLPAVGADPRATARELTQAELAAQAVGPLDTPGFTPGNANLATIVGTGRSANEVAAEQAAARAAEAAIQAGQSSPESFGNLAIPAPVPVVTFDPTSFFGGPTEAGGFTLTGVSGMPAPGTYVPTPGVTFDASSFLGPSPAAAPPSQVAAYVQNPNYSDFGQNVTQQDIPALRGTASGGFDLFGTVGQPSRQPGVTPYVGEPAPTQLSYSPETLARFADTFLSARNASVFGVAPGSVTEDQAWAAVNALVASKEAGAQISPRMAFQQGLADIAARSQPAATTPSPSPEFPSGLLAGPTDTSAFLDATFNPNFGVPPVTPGEDQTTVSTFPTDSTVGFTPSQGFGGQSTRAVTPYVEVPELAALPASRYQDFGQNVTQQNIPELQRTTSGSFGVSGPTGAVTATPTFGNLDLTRPVPVTAPPDVESPPQAPPMVIPPIARSTSSALSPIPVPQSPTNTLRIPIMPSLSESLPRFPTGGTVAPVVPFSSVGTIFSGIPGGGGGGGGAYAPTTPTTPTTPSAPNPTILYDLASFLEQQGLFTPGVTPYVGVGPMTIPEMYVPRFGPAATMAPAPAPSGGMRPISDINLPEFGPIPADSSSAPSTE